MFRVCLCCSLCRVLGMFVDTRCVGAQWVELPSVSPAPRSAEHKLLSEVSRAASGLRKNRADALTRSPPRFHARVYALESESVCVSRALLREWVCVCELQSWLWTERSSARCSMSKLWWVLFVSLSLSCCVVISQTLIVFISVSRLCRALSRVCMILDLLMSVCWVSLLSVFSSCQS